MLPLAIRKVSHPNFQAVGQSIGLHLFEHGKEAVAAGGGEVIAKANTLDEIEVGIENFLWRMVAENADEEGDDALDDQGVALGAEMHEAFGCEVGNEPHAALATVDEVLFGLLALGKGLLLRTEVDEELVAIHPVVEIAELFDDFVLYFVDSHDSLIIVIDQL